MGRDCDGQNYSSNNNRGNNHNRRGNSGRGAGRGGNGNQRYGNFAGEKRDLRNGLRGGSSYRGTARGYNHNVDWTRNHRNTENGYYSENPIQRGEKSYDNDDQGEGFKKFRDKNAPNVLKNSSSFGSLKSLNWRRIKNDFDYLPTQEEPPNRTHVETPVVPKDNTHPSESVDKVPAEPSPIPLKKSIDVKKPKLLHKIKVEKCEHQKQKVHTSSTSPKKKKTCIEAPPAVVPPPPQNESSSESSSSDSSEEEEDVPTMPKPIKATESIKPKREKIDEDDVVCLGKQSNIESLIDDDDDKDRQSKPCIVCNKKGHSPQECQMKCKKCSQSGYETQVVCKNCREPYNQSLESLPKLPNPFLMFMQFMQFYMSQYSGISSDIKYPFPQFENPSAPVLGPTPAVEVIRKDIANSISNRKRTKSGLKHSRKKSRVSINSDKDSDSDSSSKATTSTKKRKNLSKPSDGEVESPRTPQQPHPQHQFPQFQGHFPANLPFVGSGFGPPGYNPMLAFSQMMGLIPSLMNFTS